MNKNKLLAVLVFTAFSSNASAFYGGGQAGAIKSCELPKLSTFTPAHLAVVEPKTAFSFTASKKIDPRSIEVSAKRLAVDVTVTETENGYMFSGKLPESLSNTYARIDIKATTTSGCMGNEGWLLNIREQDQVSSTNVEMGGHALTKD
ncbi:MAG: hypothetical protein KUG83_03620 [Gammaproteobacteria bacterium]|nr:hypothetical protein [Gammaproteobacteria bacterium]